MYENQYESVETGELDENQYDSDQEHTNQSGEKTVNKTSTSQINSVQKSVYIITFSIMIICGSSNDFLGKLIYQMYPEKGDGLQGLYNDYWIAWVLTAGSFFICTFAIFTKSGCSSFAILRKDKRLVWKLMLPSIMDLLVTGGRYLGLIFLSAASISILKNGSQLLFLALLSRCVHHNTMTMGKCIGILITISGLIIVALEDLAFTNDVHSHTNFMETLIGIAILVTVGFLGAVRNDVEEILLKKYQLSSNFLVGSESIISLIFTIIVGVCIVIFDPFGNINTVFHQIQNDLLIVPEIIICFVLFFAAIYGKDTMQMKMTVLSSALTRKLYQQIYPSGTWMLSLICFQITAHFGEEWVMPFSTIKLGGFLVVFVGNYLYIKDGKCIPMNYSNGDTVDDSKGDTVISTESLSDVSGEFLK